MDGSVVKFAWEKQAPDGRGWRPGWGHMKILAQDGDGVPELPGSRDGEQEVAGGSGRVPGDSPRAPDLLGWTAGGGGTRTGRQGAKSWRPRQRKGTCRGTSCGHVSLSTELSVGPCAEVPGGEPARGLESQPGVRTPGPPRGCSHPPPPRPASLPSADPQALSQLRVQRLPLIFRSPSQDLTPKGSWPRRSEFARASWRTRPWATATG